MGARKRRTKKRNVGFVAAEERLIRFHRADSRRKFLRQSGAIRRLHGGQTPTGKMQEGACYRRCNYIDDQRGLHRAASYQRNDTIIFGAISRPATRSGCASFLAFSAVGRNLCRAGTATISLQLTTRTVLFVPLPGFLLIAIQRLHPAPLEAGSRVNTVVLIVMEISMGRIGGGLVTGQIATRSHCIAFRAIIIISIRREIEQRPWVLLKHCSWRQLRCIVITSLIFR